MAHQIELKHQPRRDLAVVKFRCPMGEVAQHIGPAFGAVHEYLTRAGVPIRGPAIAIYEPGEREFGISAGFIVPRSVPGDGKVVPGELPAAETAVTTHIGPYETLPGAYDAIKSWLASQGREPESTMWEEYWSEPGTPPEKIRTDIYWPVKPR